MNNLWEQISLKLKEKLPEGFYNLWIEPIKEKKSDNNSLLLSIPSVYFAPKIEEIKPDIETFAKEIFGAQISVLTEIEPPKEEKPIIKISKKKKTYQEQRRELTTFDNNPNFKSQEEMKLYFRDPEKVTPENLPPTQLKAMPGKYSTKEVATFTSFDSRYFTYPNDKRKSAKVPINVRHQDGTESEYFLYRGVSGVDLPPEGQLNTTHAKILLAVVHIWQKQGCLFAGNRDSAVVDISMRELAHELGYENSKIGGQTFKWRYAKIQELFKFPYLISNDMGDWNLFRFITNINAWSNRDDYDKLMVRLTFHHSVSRQLYERKAILRNTECYKIKNPIAFKFLFRYDKKIFMGNKLKLSIQEVVKDLQIDSQRTSSVIRTFKRALQELNGYEFDDNCSLKAELVKEEKKYYIIAERILNKQQTLNNLLNFN